MAGARRIASPGDPARPVDDREPARPVEAREARCSNAAASGRARVPRLATGEALREQRGPTHLARKEEVTRAVDLHSLAGAQGEPLARRGRPLVVRGRDERQRDQRLDLFRRIADLHLRAERFMRRFTRNPIDIARS
jgi:hypothetical protein